MMTKIRKAVFPVAGFGTRFLPATKAMLEFTEFGMRQVEKLLVEVGRERRLHER